MNFDKSTQIHHRERNKRELKVWENIWMESEKNGVAPEEAEKR